MEIQEQINKLWEAANGYTERKLVVTPAYTCTSYGEPFEMPESRKWHSHPTTHCCFEDYDNTLTVYVDREEIKVNITEAFIDISECSDYIDPKECCQEEDADAECCQYCDIDSSPLRMGCGATVGFIGNVGTCAVEYSYMVDQHIAAKIAQYYAECEGGYMPFGATQEQCDAVVQKWLDGVNNLTGGTTKDFGTIEAMIMAGADSGTHHYLYREQLRITKECGATMEIDL